MLDNAQHIEYRADAFNYFAGKLDFAENITLGYLMRRRYIHTISRREIADIIIERYSCIGFDDFHTASLSGRSAKPRLYLETRL